MGMYDDLDRYTAPALLQVALNAARDDVDKREGSVLYDALAPLSVVAANLMAALKRVASAGDIQTASGNELDWLASQLGVYRIDAVAAVREAQAIPVTVTIPVGATFKTKDGLGLTWVCTETLQSGGAVLTCSTKGSAGGSDYGALTPDEAIEGLQSISFTETRNGGADAESDADFRIRYWKQLQRKGYGGNFYDYQEWIFNRYVEDRGGKFAAIAFFPAWNGGGTVKVVPYVEAQDGSLAAPTAAMIADLKEYLDPEPVGGVGEGVAPVGHKVTVETPEFTTLQIRATVTTKTGRDYITQEEQDAAEADVKQLLNNLMLAATTQENSQFPTTANYTYELSAEMLKNAIMGSAINPRFKDVIYLTVNGNVFNGLTQIQTATSHVMPKFGSIEVWRAIQTGG